MSADRLGIIVPPPRRHQSLREAGAGPVARHGAREARAESEGGPSLVPWDDGPSQPLSFSLLPPPCPPSPPPPPLMATTAQSPAMPTGRHEVTLGSSLVRALKARKGAPTNSKHNREFYSVRCEYSGCLACAVTDRRRLKTPQITSSLTTSTPRSLAPSRSATSTVARSTSR